MTWLILIYAFTWVHAGDIGDGHLSEAERCARALAERHDAGVERRRNALDHGSAHVDEALALMRHGGGLSDDNLSRRLEAKLRFGAAFAREGLVHEAMHQALRARFRTAAGVTDAIQNFRHLDDAATKGRLIAEVIERVLQLIPRVDADALTTLGVRAAFLNMTPADLVDFRDRWQRADERDEFVGALQDTLLAMLEDGAEPLVADVLAREAWSRKFARDLRTIATPPRPEPLDESITPAAVALENRSYFDPAELREYVAASSPAARRFFIAHWLPYLRVEELAHVFDQRDAWDLKPSLGRAVLIEVQRRRAAAGRIARRDELRREQTEVERALREATPKTRDTRLRHDEVGRLWSVADAREAQRAGDRLIERVVNEGTPAEFVNTVVSVRDATWSRLRGRAELSADFVRATVERANRVGLDADQRLKIERVLADVVQFLPARQAKAPRAEIARLVTARSARRSVDPANLKKRLTEVSLTLRTLEIELAREWD